MGRRVDVWPLQDSRSFRVVWLLEELKIPYETVYAKRENNKAPANFKSAHQMGKAPLLVLEDGKTQLIESSAICEYLLSVHAEPEDKDKFLGGGSPVAAAKVRQWTSFAEGSLLTHAIVSLFHTGSCQRSETVLILNHNAQPITYSRWFMPEEHRDALPELEKRLANNVKLDLQYIDDHLAQSTSGFLEGQDLTLADIMLAFSVQFVLVRGLGAKWAEPGYENIKAWIRKLQGRDGWQRATRNGEDSYTIDAATK